MVREGLDMTDHDNELLEAVLSELTVVKNMLEKLSATSILLYTETKKMRKLL